jgi:hypothetical protein
MKYLGLLILSKAKYCDWLDHTFTLEDLLHALERDERFGEINFVDLEEVVVEY